MSDDPISDAMAALNDFADGPDWQPIDTAPKDATLVLLAIGGEGSDQTIEDVAPQDCWRTIGHNNFENDGEDRWQFAGWCWDHDHYTQGHGRPRYWLPLPRRPIGTASAEATLPPGYFIDAADREDGIAP